MAKWTAETRRIYKKTHPENFAGPGTSYPIKDASDIKSAWNLAGHAAFPDRVRAKVKKIAKRLGLSASLPSTAKVGMTVSQMDEETRSYFRDGLGGEGEPETVGFFLPDGWSIETLRMQIQDAVEDKYQESGKTGDNGDWISGCWPWLKDFDEKFCYYCLRGSDIYRESWSLDGTEVALADDQTRVLLLPDYVESSDQEPEDTVMVGYDNGVYSIATFSAEVAGDMVTRRGKVFEIGSYPDKNFSINADEMRATIATFQPIPNKGAHVPTIFDGKMGTLDGLELAEDGKTVNGTITIPRWLHELHGADASLSASLEFDRATKLIVGNTLIPNPLVGDSALMAAFSASIKEEDPATLLSTIKSMLGLSGRNDPVVFTPKEEPPVSTPTTPPANPTYTPEQIEAMQRQIATLTQENQHTKAAAHVAALSAWVLPAQLPALTAVFERAVALDGSGETVTFSAANGEEKKVGLVAALIDAIRAGKPHGLTEERVPGTALFALPNAQQPDAAKDESQQAATSMTTWAKRQGITKEGTGS